MLSKWRNRVRSVLRRRAGERELDAELQFHLDMLIEENLKRGMPRAAARDAALRTFGRLDTVKADVRSAWFSTLLDNAWRDIRHGARTLARSPGYASVVILVMALGVGANTAIFSVVNGVLLRPLPYEGGERLVGLHQYRSKVPDGNEMGFSALEIADYRTATTLQDVVEYHNMWFILLGRSEPERVATGVVSAGFFDALGVKPHLGRLFVPEDEQPGAPAVLVLSHSYWRRSFGADPSVVGQMFRMNSRPHQVIGVLPPLPDFPDENYVFMPTAACPFRSRPESAADRNFRIATAFARVKPGVRVEEAQADLGVIAARLEKAYPDAYPADRGYEIRAVPLKTELTEAFEPTLLLLLGTAGFVLLIVCASVANLLLARMARRERELAVRVALGAGRGRILRQVLTESAMLSLAGALAGLAIASAALDMLVAFASRFTPRAAEISIDQAVLLFALGMALLTLLLFGAIPALATRRDVLPSLREGTTRFSPGRQRLRGGLIVAQVAISFMLLIGAGLMVRSFVKLQQVDPGFKAEDVLTMRIDLDFAKYTTPELRADFYSRVLGRLAAEPGVGSVAASATFPLNDAGPFTLRFTIADRPVPEGTQLPQAGIRSASPAYFQALGIRLLRGRAFTHQDHLRAPRVVVINESLARHYWPGEDAVGHRVSFDGGETWETIVGVVADTRQTLSRASGDEVYWSILQRPQLASSWLVHTRTDPSRMAQQVRAVLREIDPNQPVDRFRTLDQVRAVSLAPPRLTTMLLTLFAGLALIVTAAGMAGVIALSVNQRTQEFGIRMALGAQRASVLRLVLRQGAALAGSGLILGSAGALVLTSTMSTLLFGIEHTDVITYAAVALLLILVALLACYVPARRAASVDPLVALRST